MPATVANPGLYIETLAPRQEPDTLRTDVAGFIGPTARGPLDRVERIRGWNHFQAVYGPVSADVNTPLALRGYFRNGGQVAQMIRVCGTPRSTARVTWTLANPQPPSPDWTPFTPSAGGFSHQNYAITATSPGDWANEMRVLIRYVQRGRDRQPSVDIEVHPMGEPGEYLRGLSPRDLPAQVEQGSRLIRLHSAPGLALPAPASAGPLAYEWPELMLLGGSAPPASANDYLQAFTQLADEPEAALIGAADLDKLSNPERESVLAALSANAEGRHDRQVLIALPNARATTAAAVFAAAELRLLHDSRRARNLALYHPWVRVDDPLGDITQPLREISPVGHVAGLISRLDRERGVHHSPANATLLDCVDLSVYLDGTDQGELNAAGVNPIRCSRGRGLEVWGARTLTDPKQDAAAVFLAHRRLIHRIVRAARRVAAPLVFDPNGPQLWLTLVRGLTSLLLAAFRAGALMGERPEEGFRVICDETNNPSYERDLGRVHCDVLVAPAAPMEFITLRLELGREGRLEVTET